MASSTTEYVVLRRGVAGVWVELEGSWVAAGAPKARRLAAEATGEDGEYVAVPTRSFQSEPFHFENVRRLQSGTAKGDETGATAASGPNGGGVTGSSVVSGTMAGVGTSAGSASA